MTIFEMAKRNYNNGTWVKEMVAAIVKKGLLTADEYKEITGEDYA